MTEKQKAYYEANKEKISDYRKQYYEKNKEKIAERVKAYYEKKKNNENFKLKQKAYYDKNKDLLKNKSKIYRQENKETISLQRKNKYQLNIKNPEYKSHKNEKNKIYYRLRNDDINFKEKEAKRKRLYAITHKEQIRARRIKRRKELKLSKLKENQ